MNKASTIKAQAQKYLSNGNFDKALEEYHKILSMEEVDPYDFVLAGDVHLKKGDTARAVSMYEKAVGAYENVGLYKNAAAIGKRALRLDPGLSDMYRQLGRVKLHEGLAAEALSDFLKYYEAKLKQSDIENAIVGLELACKASPKDRELSEKLCSLYEQTERTADAAKELARISAVLKERGDEEGAAQCYERALKMDAEAISGPAAEKDKPFQEPAVAGTAEPIPGQVTEFTPGLRVAEREVTRTPATGQTRIPAPSGERGPKSVSPRVTRQKKTSNINISQILKQFKAQMEDKIGPDDYQGHYDMGMTYKEMGLYEEALNELRVVSASDKFRVKAFELAGLCHLEIGEREEALEAFKRAIRERSRNDEDYPGLCFNLGTAFQALGKTEDALKCFQEVESLNPEFPQLKEKLEALQSKVEEEH